jgi:hypothetical protein
METINCHGLWVPKSDEKVFARYAEFEGLPDLEISKVAKCSALSRSFDVALDSLDAADVSVAEIGWRLARKA